MTDAFEDADFYDVHDDAEGLIYTTPEDALDAWWQDGNEPAEVTVYAFKRRVVDPAWAKHEAQSLAEHASEHFGEEYGDPDGDFTLDVTALEAALLPALDTAAKAAKVWQCEQVAKRNYTAAEVQAIVNPRAPAPSDGSKPR